MNHLLIGLGGTGGSVLRHIRKLVYLASRDDRTPELAIDYLFVDSDPKSFRDDDPKWTVLGKSLVLSERNRMRIMQSDLPAIVRDLQRYPRLKSWLGDREAWGSIFNGLNVDAAGGQMRRLGRFLFTMSIDRFCGQVQTLVGELQGRTKTEATVFHIFCGLAGGTGAGSVVDTVAQLRRLYSDPKSHRIIIYVYLPDMNPPSSWKGRNYHANAYAALLELNAMSAGAWVPFDIHAADGSPQRDNWFNGCYVFSDLNDQGFRARLDDSHHEILEILADFIYHKIAVADQVGWGDLQRFENSENGDAAPEAAPGRLSGQRSVRFMSFGLRRLAFPEETIREYLTFDFAKQSYLQLLHNNWADGLGYLESARPAPDAAFVADANQREDWRLADEHLRLEGAILDSPGSKRWQSFPKEWEAFETHYVTLALQRPDKLQWLNQLKSLFQTAWNDQYRQLGVQRFFETNLRDAGSMATEVKRRVESSLFKQWEDGEKSLSEVGRTIDALIDDLDARASRYDDFIGKQNSRALELQQQILEIEANWAKWFGNRRRTLIRMALALREQYSARTSADATRFAKALHPTVRTALDELRHQVATAEAEVGKAAEDALKIVQARAPKDGNRDEDAGYITLVGNTQVVEGTRRKLVFDEDEQRSQTAAVRSALVRALGQQNNFKSLSLRLSSSDIRNIIVKTCSNNVEDAHQRMVSERRERVIGVSIIEKLQQQWDNSPERLSREATALANSAARFVVFDNTERDRDFVGKLAEQRGKESFAIMMPKPADQADFVGKLEVAFKGARAGVVNVLPTTGRNNEITLVSLVNLFPLRFVRLVGQLKQEYEKRVREGGARALMEIHTEGDGSQLPSLFIADAGTLARDARPLLLLGKALGMIVENRSAVTGKTGLVLNQIDIDGGVEPMALGADLPSTVDMIQEIQVIALQAEVEHALAAGKGLAEEEQASALAIMTAVEKQAADAMSGDATHPKVAEWREARRRAMAILRREAKI
jgi:hypothetical protein